MNKKILIAVMLLTAFLRLWKLDQVPVSLFGDELDVGYHAYSILKTGKDYSGNFLPLHFHSLAEWRTPLYLYSAVPTVAAFGISPLGVRLPAALFGIAGVYLFCILVDLIVKNKKVALLSAFFLAISPWHIQYSRAAFEVTQLLFFLFLGLYIFFKSVENGKLLWLSAVSLLLMPWVYSTAKFFTPILIVGLVVLYRKELIKMKPKHLFQTVIASLVVGIPMVYVTLFGGAAQRFGHVGIFTDPTLEPEIGVLRQLDAYSRGELEIGETPLLEDRLFHNKFTHWGDVIYANYAQTLSSHFLFSHGDPNPRHSITGMGMFYRTDLILLLTGFAVFFIKFKDTKSKYLIALWLFFGILPASITRDGGNHATRLILILPPIIFLIAYGFAEGYKMIPKLLKAPLGVSYLLVATLMFVSYQHLYWVHNPITSARWWHYGWNQAIAQVKKHESGFEKVIISTKGEPPWIFFAANYAYPPERWNTNFPLNNRVELPGFGEISHIDKYYFGNPSTNAGVYDYGKILEKGTLYLAQAPEVSVNLVAEPNRTPPDLELLESVVYPDGEPAFYLFSKK